MKRAIIDPEKCANCAACEPQKRCMLNAFIRERDADDVQGKPWIDFYACSGCAKCKTACPFEAISQIVQPCSPRGKTTW